MADVGVQMIMTSKVFKKHSKMDLMRFTAQVMPDLLNQLHQAGGRGRVEIDMVKDPKTGHVELNVVAQVPEEEAADVPVGE